MGLTHMLISADLQANIRYQWRSSMTMEPHGSATAGEPFRMEHALKRDNRQTKQP